MNSKNVSNNYLDTQSEISNSHMDRVEDFLDYFKNEYSSSVLSQEFLSSFKLIIKDRELKKFSPLKSYWLDLIEDLFFIAELQEEAVEVKDEEILAEIIDFWSGNILKDCYLQLLDEGHTELDASTIVLSILENHIISFFFLHFPKAESAQEIEITTLYHIDENLGDYKEHIYLSDGHYGLDILKGPETYPIIPISEIDYNNGQVSIEVDTDKSIIPIEKSEHTVYDNGPKIFLLPTSVSDEDNYHELKSKLLKSFMLIESYSKDSFNLMKSVTSAFLNITLDDHDKENSKVLSFSNINLNDTSIENIIISIMHNTGEQFFNFKNKSNELNTESDEKEAYLDPIFTKKVIGLDILKSIAKVVTAHKLLSDYFLSTSIQNTSQQYIFEILKTKAQYQHCLKEILKITKKKKLSSSGIKFFNYFKKMFEMSAVDWKIIESNASEQTIKQVNNFKVALK